MTLYLTDTLAPAEIERAKDAGVVRASSSTRPARRRTPMPA